MNARTAWFQGITAESTPREKLGWAGGRRRWWTRWEKMEWEGEREEKSCCRQEKITAAIVACTFPSYICSSLLFPQSWAPPGDHFLFELGLSAEHSPLKRIAVYQCLWQPTEHEKASKHKKQLLPGGGIALYKCDTCFIMPSCDVTLAIAAVLQQFKMVLLQILSILFIPWGKICHRSYLHYL